MNTPFLIVKFTSHKFQLSGEYLKEMQVFMGSKMNLFSNKLRLLWYMVSANALLPSSLRFYSGRVKGQWNNMYNLGPCKLCEACSSHFANQNFPITCSLCLWLLRNDTWINSICLALQSEQQKFHFTPIHSYLLPRSISLCQICLSRQKEPLLVTSCKLHHLKKHLQFERNDGKEWVWGSAMLLKEKQFLFQANDVLCNDVLSDEVLTNKKRVYFLPHNMGF